MKYPLLFLALLFATTNCMAKGKGQKNVAAAVEALRNAMLTADKQALETYTHDSLSYGHSSGRIENKKEFIESLCSGKSDFVTLELSGQTISVAGKVAVVRHTLNAETSDSGKPATIKLKVLLVFTKEKTGWKLLARQAVKFT